MVSVRGAPLLLLEACGSALLPGHQRSPLPAGQGSQGSDLHLGEVEGRQVALPRFPVHSLTTSEPERDGSRSKEGLVGEEKLGLMTEKGAGENEGGTK